METFPVEGTWARQSLRLVETPRSLVRVPHRTRLPAQTTTIPGDQPVDGVTQRPGHGGKNASETVQTSEEGQGTQDCVGQHRHPPAVDQHHGAGRSFAEPVPGQERPRRVGSRRRHHEAPFAIAVDQPKHPTRAKAALAVEDQDGTGVGGRPLSTSSGRTQGGSVCRISQAVASGSLGKKNPKNLVNFLALPLTPDKIIT